MVNREEILDALELIRNICANCEDCENCPFCCEDFCVFRKGDTPESWRLNSKNDIWRAFTK